jgi:Tol biopolymer transport system component
VISDDGAKIFFTGQGKYGRQIFSRSLSELVDSTPVRGTDDSEGQRGAASFALSPDSEWVVFHTAGKLKKVRSTGGAPVTLTNLGIGGGLTWDADDNIVFLSNQGLMTISAQGGQATQLITTTNKYTQGPHIATGNTAVFYSLVEEAIVDPGQVVLFSPETGEQKVLLQGTTPQLTKSGHLIFFRDGALWAVAFDQAKREVIGAPVPVVENVYSVFGIGVAAQYDISAEGTLVYRTAVEGSDTSTSTLVTVDRQGREEELVMPPQDYWRPKISPDGERIAVQVGGPQDSDVYFYSVPRRTLRRFTFDSAGNGRPLWSPDGKRIIYSRIEAGEQSLYMKAADGTGTTGRLTLQPGAEHGSFWTADGQVFYQECSPVCRLAMLTLGDEPQTQILRAQDDHNEYDAVLSPDGHWLAYSSDESYRQEVFVSPYPDLQSGRWLVSNTTGGGHPVWSPDGSEIFYWSQSGMMAVAFNSEPEVELGIPAVMFDVSSYRDDFARNYDIFPDGNRFVMVKPISSTDRDASSHESQAVVVLNWFDELERLVPTK